MDWEEVNGFFLYSHTLTYIMSDYVSSIKAIAAPRTRVYQRLSNLSGLANIQDRLPAAAREKITIEGIDSDSCAFVVPGAGRLVLRIIEREPEGTIKLATEQSPIDLTIWIQLLEPAPGDTRLRLTLRADLNFFMRKMIGSKLNDGVEKLADMLAMIPYNY